MDPPWQKLNEACRSCHSWLILDRRRITAMTTFIIITVALAVVLALAEILREVLADRPTTPPRSHREDPTLRSPGAWS